MENTFGGCREADEVTLDWLIKVNEDKEHWYAILSRGRLYDARNYAPTVLEWYSWYVQIFGEKNLPPEYQKIRKDLDIYYGKL